LDCYPEQDTALLKAVLVRLTAGVKPDQVNLVDVLLRRGEKDTQYLLPAANKGLLEVFGYFVSKSSTLCPMK
jgi:hypothetical protein